MNESEYQDLLLSAARRDLTASEQDRVEGWLAARPEARSDWAMEQRLTRSLRRLGDVPLSSNFTARVLHKVDRHAGRRQTRRTPVWLRWLKGLKYGWQLAGALAALGLIAAVQHHQVRERAELARSLEALPAASLAEVELWRDFDLINSLPAGPVPSVDQLAQALE